MNKSNLFKLAHQLTKATIKDGDNYQVTFGASVKLINSLSNLTGSDKQIDWANKIIAVAIKSLNKTIEHMDVKFKNKQVDFDTYQLMIDELNKVVVRFILSTAKQSTQTLIKTAKNRTYKDLSYKWESTIIKLTFKAIKNI